MTMATPLRKKRNFRGLQLQVSEPPSAPLPPPPPLPVVVPETQPLVIRKSTPQSNSNAQPTQAPTTKRRPPPMTLKAPKLPAPNPTPVEDNLLSVNTGASSAPNTASFVSGRRNTYHAHLHNALANLDLNAEHKFELKAEDLRDLHELGQGNGGSVKKAEHIPSGTIMAKKVVLIDAKPAVRKQILRELQIMHDCRSKYIISFYGAFLADPNICICMEFMDRGSLDGVYKKIGAIDIDIVGKVALAVLEGLTYLYDVHRIIHRDIKPSNILCNSHGDIKICDFGVSGELINSIADTFVGTSTYMSPERIQGAHYTVKSDVWSLGISLIELALGRFPFAESDSDSDNDSDLSDLEGTLSPGRPEGLSALISSSKKSTETDQERKERKKKESHEKRKSKGVSLQGGGMTMSILELLQHIVNEPAPRLNNGPGGEGRFPKIADQFIEYCLLKDPDERWTPKDLLKHDWIEYSKASDIDMEAWANTF